MKLLFISLFSFLLTYAIIPVIISMAEKCNCVDVPGSRRFHAKSTAKWGGGAFLLGVLPAILYSVPLNSATVSYAAASAVLVGFGFFDDYRPLGWKAKFSAIALVSTIVIFGARTVITQIGSYGHVGLIELGLWSIPFTYFCIIGVTNAMNLLDGLNGLAGGASLLSFLFLGIGAVYSGNSMVAVISFSFVGVLAAFLPYNFPEARLFMGDSGSLFLGFSLAVLSILLTQGPASSVSPMYPVLVLLVPIFDTLRRFALRILNRKNPFRADKGHLHHLLVRKGISAPRATAFLWIITALCGITASVLMAKNPLSILIAVCYGTLGLSMMASVLAWRRRRRDDSARQSLALVKRSRLISLLTKLWL